MAVELELLVSFIQIAAFLLVSPHVGPALGAVGFVDAAFEPVPAAVGVNFGGFGLTEEVANEKGDRTFADMKVSVCARDESGVCVWMRDESRFIVCGNGNGTNPRQLLLCRDKRLSEKGSDPLPRGADPFSDSR